MHIHQQLYIDELVKKIKSFHIPIPSLPIVKGIEYSKSNFSDTEEEKQEMTKFLCWSVLGYLPFLCSRSRLDIHYAVNIFSQIQSNPGCMHWENFLHMLGYVSNTRNCKLKFKFYALDLVVYSDSDFA